MKPCTVTALSALLLTLHAAQGQAEIQGMNGVLDISGSLINSLASWTWPRQTRPWTLEMCPAAN